MKTQQQKLTLINQWLAHAKQIDQTYDELKRLFDASPESPMMETTNKLFVDYTRLVAEQVGDHHEWLQWYLYDCRAGQQALWAQPHKDKPGGKVETVEDLLALIEASE